jgi:hypothetical protein
MAFPSSGLQAAWSGKRGTRVNAPDPHSAHLLRSNPTLFRHIVAFNSQPAGYLHCSRRAVLNPPGVDASIWKEPRSHPFVSKWILDRIGMADRWYLEPECDAWPLALLSVDGIEKLARHVGAVLAWPRLRHCIGKEEVLNWKLGLSADAYRFALFGASLITPNADLECPVSAQDAVDQGFAWIATCLTGRPDELRVRAELKLPASCVAAQIERDAARRLVHRVLQAMDPRWSSSFAKAAV